MTLTCLLVCADAEAVQVLKSVLQELGIEVEYCADPAAAQMRIDAAAFDVLLFDCQHEASALQLIARGRRSATNGPAIIIAMVNLRNQVRDVFTSGANFVLYKPISRERAASALSAVRDLVQRERRAHARIPLPVRASIDYAGTEEVSAELSDLSETGIGFHSSRQVPPSCKVYFQFSVPGNDKLVRLSGEAMWQDATGRVGLRLVHVPQTSRRILEDWLRTALPAAKPVSAPPVPEIVIEREPSSETVGADIPPGLGLIPASRADRRVRSRESCCLGAEVYRVNSNVPHRCNLTDVSAGGCYVETTGPYPVGTLVEIVVWAQGLKFTIAGTVHTSNAGFGMGVQFALRTDDERKHVDHLMECVLAESKLTP
jgi:CheY-like chemotaxis protein